MATTPLFIDFDNTMGIPGAEIDDGLTLLYLLARQEVEIVGIGTTYGNGPEEAVAAQTRSLLDRLGVSVPLHRGFAGPGPAGGSDSAARAIVDASRRYRGRLVVLALGATTNVAAALGLDPELPARLASIRLMGGYLAPLRFPRREVEELNLSCDPDASRRVLNAACPVNVMSAQLCLSARFGPRHLLLHNRGPRWLRQSVRGWYRAFTRATGSRGFYLWDLVPAVSIVRPGLLPDAWYRIASTTADLESGALRLKRPTAGDEAPDAREAGIVSVPSRIIGAATFAADCARDWARAARRASAHSGVRARPNRVE